MNFLGMGPLELALILGLALVVFGPDKLPEIARQVGRTVGQIRRVTADVTGEIQRGLQLEDEPRVLPPSYQTPVSQPPASPPAAPRPPSEHDIRPPY